jgi:hypothetical protein
MNRSRLSVFIVAALTLCFQAGCTSPHASRLSPVDRYELLVGACRSGDERSVEILLDLGAHPDGGPDWITGAIGGKYGDEFTSPLSCAAEQGHVDIMKLLLARGAHVDLLEGEGLTALVLAISYKQRESVALLLEAGADPTQYFVQNRARHCEDPKIVEMIADAAVKWRAKHPGESSPRPAP